MDYLNGLDAKAKVSNRQVYQRLEALCAETRLSRSKVTEQESWTDKNGTSHMRLRETKTNKYVPIGGREARTSYIFVRLLSEGALAEIKAIVAAKRKSLQAFERENENTTSASHAQNVTEAPPRG